jgi:hypothetical protein
MMKVHEAWSPENSYLVFRGETAVDTVRQAVDAAYENPTLRDPELDALANLGAVIEDQVANGEKIVLVKQGVESDLVYRGLRTIVRRTNTMYAMDSPKLTDFYRSWKAERLIKKIDKATV